MIKKIGKAFITGAVVGLIGHLIITIMALFVPGDFVNPAAMLIFGIISAAVIASGAYLKIAAFGGDGAAIPLCGLMFGAAAARAEAQAKGMPKGKAIAKGFMTIFVIVGSGMLICIIIGLISKNPGISSEASPSVPMQFVFAALFGGLVCGVTQFMTCIRIPFPIAAEIDMVIFGGLLTWSGLIPSMLTMGAGGISSTGVGFGNAAYSAGAILSATGVPIPLIIVIVLIVLLVLFGALAGGSMMKKMPD